MEFAQQMLCSLMPNKRLLSDCSIPEVREPYQLPKSVFDASQEEKNYTLPEVIVDAIQKAICEPSKCAAGDYTYGERDIPSIVASLCLLVRCSHAVLDDRLPAFQLDLIRTLRETVEELMDHGSQFSSLWKPPTSINAPMEETGKSHIPSTTMLLLDMFLIFIQTPRLPHSSMLPYLRVIAKSCKGEYGEQIYEKVLSRLEKSASSIISVICSRSLSPKVEAFGSDDHGPMILLYQLGCESPVFRSKMAKRRCVWLVLGKHLQCNNDDVREGAINFCHHIISYYRKTRYTNQRSSFNLDILRDALLERVLDEAHVRMKLHMILLLEAMLDLYWNEADPIIDCFRSITYGIDDDEVVVAAAAAFCHGIEEHIGRHKRDLWTVVDLSTFPFASVRARALLTIERLLTTPTSIVSLCEDTDMLENFALIIRHGSDEDRTAALNIVRFLARSSAHHSELCAHADLLGSIVDVVTQNDVSSREVHMFGVETILALLTNDANTTSFLKQRSVLPWLVNFVNTTTADDTFKEPVVSAMVRLSLAFAEAT